MTRKIWAQNMLLFLAIARKRVYNVNFSCFQRRNVRPLDPPLWWILRGVIIGSSVHRIIKNNNFHSFSRSNYLLEFLYSWQKNHYSTEVTREGFMVHFSPLSPSIASSVELPATTSGQEIHVDWELVSLEKGKEEKKTLRKRSHSIYGFVL